MRFHKLILTSKGPTQDWKDVKNNNFRSLSVFMLTNYFSRWNAKPTHRSIGKINASVNPLKDIVFPQKWLHYFWLSRGKQLQTLSSSKIKIIIITGENIRKYDLLRKDTAKYTLMELDGFVHIVSTFFMYNWHTLINIMF